MHNLKGVQPGDELIHTSGDWSARRAKGEPEKVIAHKVGTKLVQIEKYGRLTAYRIESGIGNDYRDGTLWKPEDFELEKERPALEDALKRPHHVEVWPGQHSVPTLKKLLAILEEEAGND